MAEKSWDQYLDEYLTNDATNSDQSAKAACAAALAKREDYLLYAASPSAGEAGWGMMYAEDQEQKIMQEDGSEKPVMINEAATLKDAVERDMKTQGPSPTGLWIAGVKHKVASRIDDYDVSDIKCISINAPAKDGKGVQILASPTTVIVGMYDKKAGISAENCLPQLHAFMAYMIEQGL
jgi:hypothetical protein